MAFALFGFAVANPATAATTLEYNSAPTSEFTYGSGNDYSPANAAVLTSDNVELALRFHQTFTAAPASDSSGVYSFALGTDPLSFDWSILGDTSSALISMTNLLTGTSTSYDPFFFGNDNATNGSGAAQNSFRLNWAGIGYDPDVNNTYSVNLTSGSNSLTTYAKLGTGAVTTAAVPEPSTWAMMLLGFGFVGGAMRSAKRQQKLGVSYA
ncbi:hypothetical protein A9995_03890 [Erythrobacter sp. QSSC1-22B]|nr:hypothetical protein A9995_03890 [Erythrobacter sp. QSSC1-22B]